MLPIGSIIASVLIIFFISYQKAHAEVWVGTCSCDNPPRCKLTRTVDGSSPADLVRRCGEITDGYGRVRDSRLWLPTGLFDSASSRCCVITRRNDDRFILINEYAKRAIARAEGWAFVIETSEPGGWNLNLRGEINSDGTRIEWKLGDGFLGAWSRSAVGAGPAGLYDGGSHLVLRRPDGRFNVINEHGKRAVARQDSATFILETSEPNGWNLNLRGEISGDQIDWKPEGGIWKRALGF
jgi:hypothetical protein